MRRDPKPENKTVESDYSPLDANPEISANVFDNETPFAAESLREPAQSLGKYEGHVLIGEGVHIKGEIRDCREIEIHGTVDGDLEAEVLIVHGNGVVEGNVNADRAEVHGSVNGDISVKYRLDVKSNGSVAGATKYGELSVEAGGRVVGSLDEQTGKSDKSDSASKANPEVASTPQPVVDRELDYAD